ncbi:hypothetical protein B0H14DRAFT_2949434 [Mycena olivaceomarginata]|nr:hypothetical protein B0H14DRAFT_2949434 [Mycena olivaceomarginata]
MHPCLAILEIVETICNTLTPTTVEVYSVWRCKLDRATLSTLARTCTVFRGPALDVLWRTQTALDPFLRLLPDDLFVPLPDGARISQASQRVWKMQRPFLATDWSGTSPYAPRVKILDLRYTPPHRFVDILPALGLGFPGGLLFPNLLEFTWRSPPSDSSPIRAFFPSTLKEITLECEATYTNLSLLSALTTSCPGLRHVSMDFQPTSDEVDTAISLFVCGLQHLQSLSMRIPTMAAMQRVAQLPGMTSLSLIEFPHAFTPSGCIDPPIFSHLRRLSLGPIDIELAIKFFASLSHTPFTSLVVRLTTCPPTEAMDSLFHALQTACAQESHIITGRSLGVLACFPNIRTVSILSPVGFDLDDAALPQLAAAWPHIEWLELRGSGSHCSHSIRLLESVPRCVFWP